MANNPEPPHTCASCGARPTCAIALVADVQQHERGLVGLPLPMPCGGDLWVIKPKARRGGKRRMFGLYNPDPRPEQPGAGGAGTLDQIELP